jgi:acyl-CoA thioester hydrolase
MAHPLLAGFPIVAPLPVQWGELDAYGHLNNAVFFRFFESARVLFLDECGFLASYDENKVGAILHSTSCRFRLPLYYPDTALVGTRASEVLEDRFAMEYRVVSSAQDEVAAEGTGVVVSFDYVARKKVPLPERVREGIAALANRPPA